MEVILLERVEKLGQMGDLVNVKPGFARNYLLPKKKALRATAENSKLFDSQKAQLETVNIERRTEAEAVAAKMDGVTVVILRQASEGAWPVLSARRREHLLRGGVQQDGRGAWPVPSARREGLLLRGGVR